ncbi:hypothetical protein STCU_02532 [Strigomonas culicis]|uniref:Uncharacterized protein n=1 Tax=Strigomonas culicis TaxID=28005 RepID=S9UVT6_9TRYP|nr:hypothetical protein STCU_02532 [Strigomonas culicis]|eukprot:EPY33013.1 hypothetical protein STCU_02532 [Strigomonas culicis]
MRSFTRRPAAPRALVASCRFLSGSKGRGDLKQPRALSDVSRNRVMGIQRGLRTDSQSTQPQTGQLRVKKQIAHSSKNSAFSGSGNLTPDIAKWSHLLPSLQEGVLRLLPERLYAKCERGDALTGEEQQALSEVYRLVRFEVHQRIPLLEDSLAHAELKYMVEWPCVFRRARIKLPFAEARTTLQLAAPCGEALRLSGATAAEVTALAVAPNRDAPRPGPSPTAAMRVPAMHQIHDLDARIATLTQHVRTFVEADLDQLDRARAGVKRSARQEASEAALRKKWADAVQWHLHT